jgi:hypothetical protein
VQISDLEPFTHTAYLPVGADLSSIRLEGIKRVKVATKLRSVTDPNDCIDRGIEGIPPFCSRSTYESRVPAFRVTYSYRGPSTASEKVSVLSLAFTCSTEVPPQQSHVGTRGYTGRFAASVGMRYPQFLERSTSLDLGEMTTKLGLTQGSERRPDLF